MSRQKRVILGLLTGLLLAALSGCSLNGLFGGSMFGNSTGLQISPSSTTVSTGQAMTFQVSGGTPPYSFALSGVGSIDNSGDFQAGGNTGQTQVKVTDSSGNWNYASVSVVQSGYYGTNGATYASYTNPAVHLDSLSGGWSATSRAALKSQPLVQGQVIATDAHALGTAGGDQVRSRFVQTNLKHPVVRVDELVEGKTVVAARAVIEDQFLVKLGAGYGESDLSAILRAAGAHISRHLNAPGSYLVSLNHSASAASAASAALSMTPAVSSDYLAGRERLKQQLKRIATVTPNFIPRAPAGVSTP